MLGTNFNEILIKIQTFSLKTMHLEMSAKWCPFCLGLNVLILIGYLQNIILTLVLETEYFSFWGQYHACFCPGILSARASAGML